MDTTLAGQLLASWGLLAQATYGDVQTAIGRQRDAAHSVSLAVQGSVARMLIEAGDPSFDSNLNSAVRTPTTLDHPSIPVGNPANTAKA